MHFSFEMDCWQYGRGNGQLIKQTVTLWCERDRRVIQRHLRLQSWEVGRVECFMNLCKLFTICNLFCFSSWDALTRVSDT